MKNGLAIISIRIEDKVMYPDISSDLFQYWLLRLPWWSREIGQTVTTPISFESTWISELRNNYITVWTCNIFEHCARATLVVLVFPSYIIQRLLTDE